MNRNRFSPTRIVLVIILIGALYKVGTLVNPPPPGPPPTPTEIATAKAQAPQQNPKAAMNQEEAAKQLKDRMKQMNQQSKLAHDKEQLEIKLNGGKKLADGDGITPKYFETTTMGRAGIDQTAKNEERKKQITDEVNKRMASEIEAVKRAAKPTSAPPPDGDAPPAAAAAQR